MSFQEEIDKAIKDKKLYFVGDKLPNDWYEGVITWEKLANDGNIKAMYNVGRSYLLGKGVEEIDISTAKYWLELAAEQDEPRSNFLLYKIYTTQGNEEQAEKYLKLANILGDSRAIEEIKTINEDRLKRASELKISVLKNEYKEGLSKVGPLFQKVKNKIESGNYEGARKSIITFIDNHPDLKWISNFLPYLDLEVKFLKIKRLTFVRSNGEKLLQTYATFSATNNSNIPVRITVVGIDSTIDKTKEISISNLITVKPQSTLVFDSKVINGISTITGIATGYIEYNDSTNQHVLSFQNNLITDKDFKELPDYVSSYDRHFTPPTIVLSHIKIRKTIKNKASKCFIVTASTDCEHSELVDRYRLFRDNYLSKSKIGRNIIFYYYKVSPPIATYISNKTLLKRIINKSLHILDKHLLSKLF